MPTVRIDIRDFGRLVGRPLSRRQLEESLPLVKCEVKDLVNSQLVLETNADRPDMLSAEGMARSLEGFLGLKTGPSKLRLRPARVHVIVERNVEQIRPFISCSIARKVRFTDNSLHQLLQLQEKLHEGLCRNRRKASIGIYDLNKTSPPMKYSGVNPERIEFTPLEENKRMKAKEILDQTAKGKEFGKIISNFSKYPVLSDMNHQVLSMPPIVNSEETKLTIESNELFIDVTGLSEDLTNKVLCIIAFALGDRGAEMEKVSIDYRRRTSATPVLRTRKIIIDSSIINSISGLNLKDRVIVQILRRMRMESRVISRGKIEVEIPPYRADIMHSVDVVEDVIIGYGYHKIPAETLPAITFGHELKRSVFIRRVRDIMASFGFQEILNYLLTNPELQVSKMNLDSLELVELTNPLSGEYSTLRRWLLPGILNFLSKNSHVDYPQKVFECGDGLVFDEKAETQTRSELKLAVAVSDDIVSFESIQGVLYGLLSNLGCVDWHIEPTSHPSFVAGRNATIVVGDMKIAILGEVYPAVLNRFGIPNPTAAFELDLGPILASGFSSN